MGRLSAWLKKNSAIQRIYDRRVITFAGVVYGGSLVYMLGRAITYTMVSETHVQSHWQQYRQATFSKDSSYSDLSNLILLYRDHPLHPTSKLRPLTLKVLKDYELLDKRDKFKFFTYWSSFEKADTEVRRLIKLFINGEVLNFGLFQNFQGYALVGLPSYLDYDQDELKSKTFVLPNGQTIDYGTINDLEFKENVYLSDKAKKYLIAEAIHKAKSAEHILRLTIAFNAALLSILCAFRMDTFLHENKSGLSRNMKLASACYVGLLAYVATVCLFKRVFDNYSKIKIDQFLEGASKEYIEGGLEYYEKFRARNRLMYRLLGNESKSYYKPNGDEVKFPSAKYTVNEMLDKLSAM